MVETRAEIRLQVGKLLGSLVAVDPDDQKYAALPIHSLGGQCSHIRGVACYSNCSPPLKTSSLFSRIGGAVSLSRLQRSISLTAPKTPGNRRKSSLKQCSSYDLPVVGGSMHYRSSEDCGAVQSAGTPSDLTCDDPQQSLAWFSFPVARIECACVCPGLVSR